MSAEPIGLGALIAFLGGIVSFVSPCVFPLIPGYLSFVSGVSVQELEKGLKGKVLRVFFSSLLFVLGFSVIFVLLGASASLVGGFLITYKSVLTKIAGILIIFLGLVFLEVIKIPFLLREKRFHLKEQSLGVIGIILFGAAFGFAWIPCLGPILSSIIILASTTGTASKGALLLSAYSLGLGVPFILSALLLGRFLTTFSWIKRHYRAVTYVSGLFLIAIGVLLLTPWWGYLSSKLSALGASSSSLEIRLEKWLLKLFQK